MKRPTNLLLRVDSVVYARTVLTFNKSRARLCYYGLFGVQGCVMGEVNHIGPFIVRHLKVREVI